MELQSLQTFLGWCTLLNILMIWITFAACIFMGDFIHRFHNRWFPMTPEARTAILYSYLAGYKLLVIFFNLIPYVVLACLF